VIFKLKCHVLFIFILVQPKPLQPRERNPIKIEKGPPPKRESSADSLGSSAKSNTDSEHKIISDPTVGSQKREGGLVSSSTEADHAAPQIELDSLVNADSAPAAKLEPVQQSEPLKHEPVRTSAGEVKVAAADQPKPSQVTDAPSEAKVTVDTFSKAEVVSAAPLEQQQPLVVENRPDDDNDSGSEGIRVIPHSESAAAVIIDDALISSRTLTTHSSNAPNTENIMNDEEEFRELNDLGEEEEEEEEEFYDDDDEVDEDGDEDEDEEDNYDDDDDDDDEDYNVQEEDDGQHEEISPQIKAELREELEELKKEAKEAKSAFASTTMPENSKQQESLAPPTKGVYLIKSKRQEAVGIFFFLNFFVAPCSDPNQILNA
jgi:hypothetical protein